MKKFHVTLNNEVRPCNAEQRKCRYGENKHFLTKNDAYSFIDENQAENVPQLTKSSLPKKIRNELKNFDESVSSFVNIGKIVEQEIERKLGFNPNEKEELSEKELKEISQLTRNAFNNFKSLNTQDNNLNIIGPLTAKLKDSIGFLPPEIHHKVNHIISTKTVSSKTRKFDGKFEMGYFEQSRERIEKIYSGYIPDVPDGTLFTDDLVNEEELSNKSNGQIFYVKKGQETELQTRWVGKLPKGMIAKKISSQSTVYSNGESITVDQPLYSLKEKYNTYGINITAVGSLPEEKLKSVLLHEYSHALQHVDEDIQRFETDMFHSTRGPQIESENYDNQVCYSGFPDEYMGSVSGQELFPKATETVFYPHVNEHKSFYGKDRHVNADTVRQWTLGVWAYLALR